MLENKFTKPIGQVSPGPGRIDRSVEDPIAPRNLDSVTFSSRPKVPGDAVTIAVFSHKHPSTKYSVLY